MKPMYLKKSHCYNVGDGFPVPQNRSTVNNEKKSILILPKRKINRLQNYDYSSAGVYFITLCTEKRIRCLSVISVGDGFPVPKLTENGKLVERYIKIMSEKYTSVSVDKYVIMPDHIHLLLNIGTGDPSPTVGTVMGWFKYVTTKQINSSNVRVGRFWQRSYFDHVIRNQEDYNEAWRYIDENCLKWNEKGEN